MKISIITAVYNREKYIEKTILSVLNQTYGNIEYIIVDGGSDDGTVEIIKKYQTQLFHWLSEPDTSMYDAINKGILMSTGDYILNLNSDDWLFNHEVIENVVLEMKNTNGYEAYFGNLVRFYQDNNYYRKILLKDVSFNTLLLSEHSTFVPHPSLFVSKKVIKEVGLYDLSYKYASDYDFILSILKKYKIKHIPLFITIFREHHESITASGKIDLERKDILSKHGLYKINTFFRKYKYYKNWIIYKLKNLR